MNYLTFDPDELSILHKKNKLEYESFNAAFINSDSYSKLLDLVDIYYGLGMKTDTAPYPLREHCYLLISRNKYKLSYLLGRKIRLKVTHIFYNKHYGLLAAKVKMNNNFTCNKTPHLIIAKDPRLSNKTIAKIVNGEMDYAHPCLISKLQAPCTLHGQIGVLFNSDFEVEPNEGCKITDRSDGIKHINREVDLPELTITVDNFPPPMPEKKFVTLKNCDDNLQSPDNINENNNEHEQDEMYQGCLVKKGPRGGKYYIKDGKKRYLYGKPGEETELAYNKGIIYQLNLKN